MLINGQTVDHIESDYAIDQIEAHETVSFDADNVTYNIPFHAIELVAVGGRGVTPVTPKDDNCQDAPVSTQKWYYTEDERECFDIHDGDSVHVEGCMIAVYCEDGSAFSYLANNEDVFFESHSDAYQFCGVTVDNYLTIGATKNNAQSAITVTSDDSQITFDLTLDTECGD